MNASDLLNELTDRLSASAKAAARQLQSTPEAQAMIARVEGETLARRKELSAQLAPAAGYEKAALAAARARDAAAARVEVLEQQLRAARADKEMATAAVMAVEIGESSRVATLRKELIESADGRLQKLAAKCRNLMDDARAKWRLTEVDVQTNLFSSNEKAVNTATAALSSALASAEALMLAPVPRDVVTQRIARLLATLEAPLAALELHPPRLDDLGNLVDANPLV